MPEEPRRDKAPEPTSASAEPDAFDATVRSIEQRKEAVGTHMPENPEYEAELEERLRRLEHRVRKAKANEAGRAMRTDAVLKPDAESHRQLGVGLSIAYAIIGMPVVGYGLGYLLDAGKPNQLWTPWTSLAGCLLGVIYALFVLNRENQRR